MRYYLIMVNGQFSGVYAAGSKEQALQTYAKEVGYANGSEMVTLRGEGAVTAQLAGGYEMHRDTWKNLLVREMNRRRETLEDLEALTLSNAELNAFFDAGYGRINGRPFTAWTADTVYFPLCYDGAESVGSVSRHPDGQPTEHQGG